MVALYVTTENNDHTHTITNPGTGFTDETNGHKHGLIKGCSTCQKIRATLGVQTIPTTFVQGHLHFINSGSLYKQ